MLFRSEPPPQYTPSPYPSIQEHYDPTYDSRVQQESRDHFKESVDQFHATLHQLNQAINQLASRCSETQGTPMASCGQSNEERSMKETLETPVDNKEHDFVLEQVEEARIIEEEELVEDLGDTERP